MSPTVFRLKKYRFYFFSREEERMHVHVSSPDGEAKFWIKPIVALSDFHGFSEREIRQLQLIIEDKKYEIEKAWKKYFKKS